MVINAILTQALLVITAVIAMSLESKKAQLSTGLIKHVENGMTFTAHF
jgi:hypothetical protein